MKGKKSGVKKGLFGWRFFFLDLAKAFTWLSFVIFFRTKYIRAEGAAKRCFRGRAVIVSNHVSYMEPLIIMTAFFARRIRFLVTNALFHMNPFFSFILARVGCIPIDQQAPSMQSMNEMIDTLEEDRAICIFPEGHLSPTGELMPFRPGAIMVALKTGAPIIPVYVKSVKSIWPRRVMVIGAPICLGEKGARFPSAKRIDEMCKMLYGKVEALGELIGGKQKRPAPDISGEGREEKKWKDDSISKTL